VKCREAGHRRKEIRPGPNCSAAHPGLENLRSARMTEVFNIFGSQHWDAENDIEGYRHRRAAVGERLGSRLLGASLYELPPGERTWPFHYEEGCEEWVIVVSGTPVLRREDGERELRPGDVVVFPEGPKGAHQLSNRSSERCRVLIFSSRAPVAIVRYPDSAKIGFWSQSSRRFIVRDGPELDYWEGET
jgi:uncharacterized cupin superfamily protein